MAQGKKLTDFESTHGSEFDLGEFDLRRALSAIDRSSNEVPEGPIPRFIDGDEDAYDDRYDDAESEQSSFRQSSVLYQKTLVGVIFSSRLFQSAGLAAIAASIVFAVVSVGNPFMLSTRSRTSLSAAAADSPTASEAPAPQQANLSPTDAVAEPPPHAMAATTAMAPASPDNGSATVRDDSAAASSPNQTAMRQPDEHPAAPAAAPLRASRMDPDQLALFKQYKTWEAESGDPQAQSPDRNGVAAEPATPTKFEEFLKRKFDEFLKQNPSASREQPPDAYRDALFKQFQAWELEHGGRARAQVQPQPRSQRRRAALSRPEDLPMTPLR